MARLVTRVQLFSQFIRVAVVAFLVWRNVRQLLQSHQYSRDLYDDRFDDIHPHIELLAKQAVQRSASSEELEALFEEVEASFFDAIDSRDWPPVDMLQSVVNSSSFSTSDLGIRPNHPRLIVTTSSFKDVDLADSFANTLLSLEVTNFVLVPLDKTAYRRLSNLHPNHTLPPLPGFGRGNDDKQNEILVAFRPLVISLILKRGFAVFYNDVDMVWRKNVWVEVDRLFSNTTDDKELPENLPSVESMFWHDQPHLLCNCMMYLLPTVYSLYTMERWGVEILSKVHDHDQAALTELVNRLRTPWIWGSIPTIGITDNDSIFPAAESYPWDSSSPEKDLAAILHNNFRTTKEEQRERLLSNGLWKPSKFDDDTIWPPGNFMESLIEKNANPWSGESADGTPRIIVTASNSEDVEFAGNFANGLLSLGISNFVFVSLDNKTHEILKESYPEHTLPLLPELEKDKGNSGSGNTGSRPQFIQSFLRKGYAVFFNDIDIIWKDNPWEIIDDRSSNSKFDTLLWKDVEGRISSSMLYVAPTADSMHLLKEWEDEINSKPYQNDGISMDQEALVVALKSRIVSTNGTKVIDDEMLFPGGKNSTRSRTKPKKTTGISGKKSSFVQSKLWKPSSGIITPVTDAKWPPKDIIDSILSNAKIPSSAVTRNGIPRVIVAASNFDYIEFADSFASILTSLAITNFVLVPLDTKAQGVLEAVYPNNTVPMMPGVNGAESSRPQIIKSFLRKGYAVFYNDVDIVWRSNAFDTLDYFNADYAFDKIMWQGADSQVCPCMLYLLPTTDSILMMEEWERGISSDSHEKDPELFVQDALAVALNHRGISPHGGTFGSAKVIVSDMFFPSGTLYSWIEKTPENENAIIIQNNGITDKKGKKSRFIRSKLWKPSGRLITGTNSKWPPKDFIDSILSNAVIPSSAVTRNGIPRLIIAASNYDYVDFADNFASSLLSQGITNFVFVPLDTKVHDVLKAGYPNNTLPVLPGLESHHDGKAEFGSRVFKTLTSSRPRFIQAFLRKGYAILYNDIDIIWRSNTWDTLDYLNSNFTFDKILWQDTDYQVCSCMLYLLPTADSIFMMEEWEDEINSDSHQNDPAAFDQEALAVVLERREILTKGGDFGTAKVIINDMFFPAGKHYSWNESKPENENAVMVHNNWIVGKKNKKARFIRSKLWKPSGRIITGTDAKWPPKDFIDSVLRNAKIPSSAVTPNGIPRLVICATNYDYTDFADNFVHSLLSQGITNFVIVPLDTKAHDVMKAAYPNNTLPILPGLESHHDGKAEFGSRVFKTLTSSRPQFIQAILRKGYAILYNDIDIVWQHNVFNSIDSMNVNNTFDKILWQDTDYQVCSCMLYLLPTADSIFMMEEWEDEINSDSHQNDPAAFDQEALAVVLERREILTKGGDFGTAKVIINDMFFPAGKHYSWNKTKPENSNAVMVHNNWIVGKKNKKARFIRSKLWKPSGRVIFGQHSEWPPNDFLDSILNNTKIPSSAMTQNGIPRLIVAASNYDYVEFADNFANSLLSLNVTNFVFVPLDTRAHDVLKAAYPNHTLPMMPGLGNQTEGSADFGSPVFKNMTSSRPQFIQAFLRKGYAVFYNDIDMVWQHDAWNTIDSLSVNNTFDKLMWQDTYHQVCSCMLYLLPTTESIVLMEEWEAEISSDSHQKDPEAFDQEALAVVLESRKISKAGGISGTTMVRVTDDYFPNGWDFSWNETLPVNDLAIIVHNNWITGKREKKIRFIRSKLWKPSGSIIGAGDPNWPSNDFLDSLLNDALIPSSAKTSDGIPRLIVAASSFDSLDLAGIFANNLLSMDITNFVLVPLDTKAHKALHAKYPSHTLPTLPGLENHSEGNSETLTSSRPRIIPLFLQHGYAVLYNDIGVVWKKNAWDVIDNHNSDNKFDKIFWQGADQRVFSSVLYLLPTADAVIMMDEWDGEIMSGSQRKLPSASDALADVIQRRKNVGAMKVVINDNDNWIVGTRGKLLNAS